MCTYITLYTHTTYPAHPTRHPTPFSVGDESAICKTPWSLSRLDFFRVKLEHRGWRVLNHLQEQSNKFLRTNHLSQPQTASIHFTVRMRTTPPAPHFHFRGTIHRPWWASTPFAQICQLIPMEPTFFVEHLTKCVHSTTTMRLDWTPNHTTFNTTRSSG